MSISVFLADDHAVVRDGLWVLLDAESDIDVIGAAEDGRNAADQVATGNMDPTLPPGGGDEVGRLSAAFSIMVAEVRSMLRRVEQSRHMSAIDNYAEELHAANEEPAGRALADPLTGLFNQKHAMDMLDVEIQRAVRHDGQLTVLRVAIDGIDAFGSKHGERRRDAAIRQIADLVGGGVRRLDFVSHLGDGQFLLSRIIRKSSSLMIIWSQESRMETICSALIRAA